MNPSHIKMIDMQKVLFMLVLIFPLTTSTQANGAIDQQALPSAVHAPVQISLSCLVAIPTGRSSGTPAQASKVVSRSP